MANIKITDLDAYADPKSTDVLPAVDVTNDETKKVSIADLMENAGSGTEAAPGIAFDGDPNTGIYRPGADRVAVATNGQGRLFINSTGLVGINNSNPQYQLDLNQTGNTSLYGAGINADLDSSDHALKFTTWGNTGGRTGSIRFITGNATGGAERLRITSDAYVRLASGTSGIQFNGDTAAANALDDYEEGTWTPVFTDGTNNATFSVLACRYTKVGRFIYVRGTLLNVNTTGMTAAASLTLTGLPYALSPNITNARLAFPIGTSVVTTTKGIAARLINNQAQALFYEVDDINGTTVKVSALTSGNADFFISLSYETA